MDLSVCWILVIFFNQTIDTGQMYQTVLINLFCLLCIKKNTCSDITGQVFFVCDYEYLTPQNFRRIHRFWQHSDY